MTTAGYAAVPADMLCPSVRQSVRIELALPRVAALDVVGASMVGAADLYVVYKSALSGGRTYRPHNARHVEGGTYRQLWGRLFRPTAAVSTIALELAADIGGAQVTGEWMLSTSEFGSVVFFDTFAEAVQHAVAVIALENA